MAKPIDYHETLSNDTGSLCTGTVRPRVGALVHIEGERFLRRVTYVMGRPPRIHACFKGQGIVPVGRIRFGLVSDEAAPNVAAGFRDVSIPARRSTRQPDESASMRDDTPQLTVARDMLPRASELRSVHPILVVGLDSAWTSRGSGGLHGVRIGPEGPEDVFSAQPATFADAWRSIDETLGENEALLHAIDQGLIVPNGSGRRPVEAALAPMLGRCGSGIQPCNGGRSGMFDDDAPIWSYLRGWTERGASLDPMSIPGFSQGLLIFETYPAMSLLGLFPCLLAHQRVLRYNPERATFRLEDWAKLTRALAAIYDDLSLEGSAAECGRLADLQRPRKADQDCLDAMICTLIALIAWARGSKACCCVGDTDRGYVVLPATSPLIQALRSDAALAGAPLRALGESRA